MKWILLMFLTCSLNAFAQYPFEKYPAIKYDTVSFKIIESGERFTNIAIAKYKNYRIELRESHAKEGRHLLIYLKNKLIKKVEIEFFLTDALTGPLYIADFDNDGRLDFKITFWSVAATGLASSRQNKYYLFNKGHDHFDKINFYDFFSYKEYNLGNNGRYEIIGQSLIDYKGHSYWLFDLYNYKNDKLVNVSKQYGYPIAIPYLNKETFIPTNKIPRRELDKLSLKYPEFYNSN